MSKKIDDVTVTSFKDKDVITEITKTTSPAFILLQGEETLGKLYVIDNNDVIGRSSVSKIRLNDTLVSREHARIRVTQDKKVFVHDLDSKNGTFINGKKLPKSLLKSGDRVKVGNTVFKFTYYDSEEKSIQDRLFTSAVEDSLTKIYNRRFFIENLAREFSFSKRHGMVLAIVIFDIDHFKKINDTYGHAAGDYVLKELASIINKSTREEDLFARIGGEEFAILLKNTKEDIVYTLCERLRKSVQNTPFKFKQEIRVTVSVGCTMFTGKEYKNYQAFMDVADKNLYTAKERGRNNTFME